MMATLAHAMSAGSPRCFCGAGARRLFIAWTTNDAHSRLHCGRTASWALCSRARKICSETGQKVGRGMLQNMVDRGEAATVKEAKQIVGRKSYDTQMQSMIDHGQAASAEEAKRMLAKKGHVAMLQAMVDRGDAATTEEAKQVSGRRLRATMLQGKIDRGEVVTLEEAEKRLISTASTVARLQQWKARSG